MYFLQDERLTKLAGFISEAALFPVLYSKYICPGLFIYCENESSVCCPRPCHNTDCVRSVDSIAEMAPSLCKYEKISL